MHKLLLDTDIGTDVDDILALSLILGSPELELIGITAAYGDTPLRAGLIREVLSRAGREDIPVAVGRSSTLNGKRKPWMAGHEGRNAGLGPSSTLEEAGAEAVELILSSIEQNPGEVILFAIAPLTNIALACERAPDVMRRLKAVYLMGGAFAFHDPDLSGPRVEHNIRCDPEAARVVFQSGLPIKLFPLDVTLRARLDDDDIEAIASSEHPLRRFLREEMATWLDFLQREFRRDVMHLHDPLTIAALLDPSIVKRTLARRVAVECDAGLTTGMTVPVNDLSSDEGGGGTSSVEIVMDVDVPRFHRLFMERITGIGRLETDESAKSARAGGSSSSGTC